MVRVARWVWGGALALLAANLFAFYLAHPGDQAIRDTVQALYRLKNPALFWFGFAVIIAGVGGTILFRGRKEEAIAGLVPELSYSPMAVPNAETVVAVRQELQRVDAHLHRVCSRAEPDAVRFVADVLEAAISIGASDIHVHPLEEGMRVKFRVHGLMEDVGLYPMSIHPRVVMRLKVLSNLTTFITDRPQDGHFTHKRVSDAVDIRISILPTTHGEKIVLRLLRGGIELPDLASLGIPEKQCRIVENLLLRPQGMMFLTGPTGSGKTTTIYSALGHIRRARGGTVQIATIEDPVEYDIPFLTQTEVSAAAGLDFAKGLRSILRQDPDVIVVGEIRDTETAQIAVQAGLTGHLIVTSVHANSAAGVFNRLTELGIEPFLLASATLACVSQRLIRGLCPYCRKETPLTDEEQKFLQSVHAPPGGTYFTSVGCPRCAGSGYLTRMAVFELLTMSPILQDLIQKRMATPDLERAARAEGMVPLPLSALARAREGATTVREVMRVSG
jgi:general secretion pathway protein E